MIDNTKQKQIDYSELKQVKGAVLNMSLSSSWKFLVASTLAVVTAVTLSVTLETNLWPIGILLFLIGGLYLIVASYRQQKRNQAALAAFATRNGFKYDEKLHIEGGIGSLFAHGHSKSMRNVISGTLSELAFKFFQYNYTTGSGKNSQTHDAMVMEIELPRLLPQFVINSVIESESSTLPIDFDKSQKIELEGDFHKYFDLYAPDTYGVSALTLLAPDTMEVLMRYAALCDVEIIQDKLYFYWPVPAKTQSDYIAMFETAETVLTKMKPKLTQDNIFATQSQEQVHTTVSGNGVRLKKSSAWVFTVIFVLLYLGVEVFGRTKLGPEAVILFGAMWAGGIGWVIYKAMKQNALRREYMSRYQSK